jgi:hypothetical protein
MSEFLQQEFEDSARKLLRANAELRSAVAHLKWCLDRYRKAKRRAVGKGSAP